MTQRPPIDDLLASKEEAQLLADERWLSVQRIAASAGFQRAGQLRSILFYVTRFAILRPDVQLHEYEIACEALGRRSDFDPVSDNIVRAQMSHLRRKLTTYYLEEGRHDPLWIALPKGSYTPTFHHPEAPIPTAITETDIPEHEPVAVLPPHIVHPNARPKLSRNHVLLGLGLLLVGTLAGSLWRRHTPGNPDATAARATGNAFTSFLHRSPGNVSVVLPDTSLALLQQDLQSDISAQKYSRSDYLDQELTQVPEPALREFLVQIKKKRYTSSGEAIVASDFQRVLTLAGISNSLRYARDLHLRDLNEGNTILIGSHKSNPWASVFNERMNFVFMQDPVKHVDFFVNTHPRPGEQPRYIPFETQGDKLSSYIDVALTPNLTRSGYILLFNGSDSQAVEAAAHFLLYGKLPPIVDDLLKHPDLSYFEIFLRGSHREAESEDTFDVIAVRSASGN